MNERVTDPIDRKGLREFGLITGGILAVLFGVALPWLFDHGWPLWPWLLGGLLAGWALVWPAGLRPVYRGWMKFGAVLGWINSRIILGLMFYLLVLPAGLIMRLFGKDPMRRRFDRSAETYRVASKEPPPHHMRRPF